MQRAKVEAVLKKSLQAEAEWQPNGSLHVLQRLPAIRRIASTGKPTFFNGFAGVYGRARDNQALDPPYRGLDNKYHLPTTYGDNTPIPTKYLERLLDISDEIRFLVPWEAGDVALIDNYTVQVCDAPGRMHRLIKNSRCSTRDRLGKVVGLFSSVCGTERRSLCHSSLRCWKMWSISMLNLLDCWLPWGFQDEVEWTQ